MKTCLTSHTPHHRKRDTHMPRGRPHMQHSASVSVPGGSSVMPATEMSPHGLLIAPASVQLPSVRSVGDLATTSITPAESSAISRSMDICSFRDRPTRFGIWGSGRIQVQASFSRRVNRWFPLTPCIYHAQDKWPREMLARRRPCRGGCSVTHSSEGCYPIHGVEAVHRAWSVNRLGSRLATGSHRVWGAR